MMADADFGGRRVDTDLRLWDDETRRLASLIVLGLAGVFLVGALLYFGIDAAGSGWFLWVAIAVLALLLLAEAAIIATGVAREEGGPEWLAGPQAAATTTQEPAERGPASEPAPEPESETEHVHVDLKCPQCGDLFSVHDTGERPLHTQCPHCGAEGHVDLETPPPGSVHDRKAEAEPATHASAREPFGDIDPVADVEGIGPTYGEQLTALGIETTRDLWEADTVQIAAELDTEAKRVESWQQRAELMAISGIGPQYAELLERVGVETIPDLASADAVALTRRIQDKEADLVQSIQGNPITETRVERWIAMAQGHDPDAERDVETISIKCPACDTQFDVEDTGERPLEATCPGCGRGGKLK